MGISEAYGRAIGTNSGFSSIAQKPPSRTRAPPPPKEKWSSGPGGGQRAKLAKPTLRTSGPSTLIACQHADAFEVDDLRTQ